MTNKLPKSSALYVPKNKYGDIPKKCGNCMMYLKDTTQCGIHDPKIKLPEKSGKVPVCGYYINGKPMTSKDHPSIRAVTPDMSGLVYIKGKGTLCANCIHFKMPNECKIVCSEGKPDEGEIDPDGCCALWKNDELELEYEKGEDDMKNMNDHDEDDLEYMMTGKKRKKKKKYVSPEDYEKKTGMKVMHKYEDSYEDGKKKNSRGRLFAKKGGKGVGKGYFAILKG